MIEFSAQEISDATGGQLAGGLAPNVRVTGAVTTDSRQVGSGDCFVAIAGERLDGHRYLGVAQQNGASVVISEQETAGPHLRVCSTVAALGALAKAVLARLRQTGEISVIGITGSSGKTTTKDLLGAALTEFAPTVFPVASFNNEIGMPLTVLRCDYQTRYLVLEMGAAAAGELTRLTAIAPLDVAVILMVGHAHLGGFGALTDVGRAKSELVQGLPPGARVVLNADDEVVAAMAQVISYADGTAVPESSISYFSAAGHLAHHPGLAAADITLDPLGRARFRVGESYLTLPITGVHHVNNALAALSAVAALGLDLTRAAGACSRAAISPHRMALTQRRDGVSILDDAYNANPESMRAAIGVLAKLPAVRRIALLGTMLEMGSAADTQHREVGAQAAQAGISWVISVAADTIADGARAAAKPPLRVDSVASIAAARKLLDAELTEGDVILIKGSNGAGLWSVADDLVSQEESGV